MEPARKYFTVTWRLENYNFCFKNQGEYYYSPSFLIDSLKDMSWQLHLYSHSRVLKGHLRFSVKRIGSSEADFRLDHEISVFADDVSSPLHTEYSYTDPGMVSCSYFQVPHDRIHTQKEGEMRPPKTLIIRCRIHKSKVSFSEESQCFIRTRIRVERTAFIGLLEKFSKLVPDEKRILVIKSSSIEKPLFTLNLSLTGDLCCKERVWVEIIPEKKDYVKFCKCKLYLLDSEGTKTECGRSKILFTDPEQKGWKFPLNFTKGNLMKKNTEFLLNDTLALKCEFAFSTGIEYESLEDSEIGILIVDKNQPRKFPSAMEDMTCLYKEGVLCDMKLRTDTETFNVHKNILSARSSVFKTMFTTDMKEKTNDCVHIEDLDADTVRRMLTFLYSDQLEDLDWENAKRLYFAADKYNIVALKYRCSKFLLGNLQPSDSCDLLILSDRHQDEELKKEVQQYLAQHHEEIILSDQWMNLQKSNPMLVIEIFQTLYLRNWKK